MRSLRAAAAVCLLGIALAGCAQVNKIWSTLTGATVSPTAVIVAANSFDAIGAPAWAARARADLARIGGRPPSVGELTPSERRIIELIAEGCTNREIGERLFLSPKTVETHVSRIFTKLGVKSRREVARHADSRRQAELD